MARAILRLTLSIPYKLMLALDLGVYYFFQKNIKIIQSYVRFDTIFINNLGAV